MCLIRVNMVGSLNATMPCRTNNKPIFPCSLQEQNTTKVRKPYTITKQREKWTGDEHQKFLEAIKLHGRAWKSVEEHIGTKNAAQIRSHAQKFFTKVVRELTNGNAGSVIEVPPPRPKKKSTHPYPRKSDIWDKTYLPLVHLIPDEVNASEDTKHDERMGSSASVAQSNTNLSESCISGSISPVSRSTDHKNNGGNLGLVSASVELNTEDHHVEEQDNTCVKSFQLFGATIIVADVNISSSVHPRQDIEEVNKVNAAANRETVYDCSHGLLPFFKFASDMDLAAAPVALAKLSINNCHI